MIVACGTTRQMVDKVRRMRGAWIVNLCSQTDEASYFNTVQAKFLRDFL